MHLLLLSMEFPPGPGGVGTLAYQVARYLGQKGWQVIVAAPQNYASDKVIAQFHQNQPFCIVRFTYKGPALLEGLNRLWLILEQIHRNRPKVVLALGRQSIWLGAIIHCFFGIPLVAIGVGTEFVRGNQVARNLTRWALARAGLVIFISRYAYALALEYGFKVAKAKVIPPGVDDKRFKPGLPTKTLRESLGLNDARIILTVGQVSERKAQDTVIRAMPYILKDQPKTKYVMVGLPTKRKEIEMLARDLGVEPNVVLTGLVDREQLPYYYNLAEVFVMVSRYVKEGEVEGFGIAVLEAAMCAVPAVVSSGSGLEEAVIPNQTALVIEPDDPQATAQAILRLLNDERLRRKMSGQAFRYVQENATMNQRMGEYELALREFIHDRQL